MGINYSLKDNAEHFKNLSVIRLMGLATKNLSERKPHDEIHKLLTDDKYYQDFEAQRLTVLTNLMTKQVTGDTQFNMYVRNMNLFLSVREMRMREGKVVDFHLNKEPNSEKQEGEQNEA